MSVKSEFTVTKFPDGTIYVAGEPKFVGRFTRFATIDDPEMKELLEAMQAVLHPKGEA